MLIFGTHVELLYQQIEERHTLPKTRQPCRTPRKFCKKRFGRFKNSNLNFFGYFFTELEGIRFVRNVLSFFNFDNLENFPEFF